jgi:hypothetical protein
MLIPVIVWLGVQGWSVCGGVFSFVSDFLKKNNIVANMIADSMVSVCDGKY